MVAVPDGDGQYRMPPLPFSFTLLSCELAYMRPGENCGYTIDWPIARTMREAPPTRWPRLEARDQLNGITPHDRQIFDRFLSRIEDEDRAAFVRAEVEAMDWPNEISVPWLTE